MASETTSWETLEAIEAQAKELMLM